MDVVVEAVIPLEGGHEVDATSLGRSSVLPHELVCAGGTSNGLALLGGQIPGTGLCRVPSPAAMRARTICEALLRPLKDLPPLWCREEVVLVGVVRRWVCEALSASTASL